MGYGLKTLESINKGQLILKLETSMSLTSNTLTDQEKSPDDATSAD